MGQILRNWRILTAAAFSVFLIAGAYALARGIETPPVAQASAETALLQAIASKDSDNDGLPDWEEALYGTDPTIADTFHLGMTDGEAVAKGLIVPKAIADITSGAGTPTKSNIDYAAKGITAPVEGTLTDAFAKNFFTLYVKAKQANGGTDLSSAEISGIVDTLLSSVSTSLITAPDFKSAGSLSVVGSGADALRTFAANAEAVITKNTSTATTSELFYLEYAVNGDDVAVTQLASLAKSYRNTAAGLAALPVPQELATSQLDLINAFMRVSEIINDFSRVNTDSLTAMIALEQYVPAAKSMGQALATMSTMYRTSGVVIPSGTAGAVFVSIANNALAQQQAASANNL